MKGILFSKDLIPKVMDGSKTVTRRCESSLKEINKEPFAWYLAGVFDDNTLFRFGSDKYGRDIEVKPRYHEGETVYLKEAWADMVCVASTEKGKGKGESRPLYKASADNTELKILAGHWKSPLFMPEWASRCKLKILKVSVERLQDITEEEAIKEGFACDSVIEFSPALAKFMETWDALNSKRGYSWEDNPYVFRYEFQALPSKQPGRKPLKGQKALF